VNPAFHTSPVLPPAFVSFVPFCGKEPKADLILRFSDSYPFARHQCVRCTPISRPKTDAKPPPRPEIPRNPFWLSRFFRRHQD
jgi:hypothetical protein